MDADARGFGGLACRGIRGAITTGNGGAEAVSEATVELLQALVDANGCRSEDLAAAIFTVTPDLAGTNPAAAARRTGWDGVPLLVVQEHAGDTGLSGCIRVLLLWNTTTPQDQVRHRYLREAARLRPDLVTARD